MKKLVYSRLYGIALAAVTVGVFALLLLSRFQLGQIRYFDSDEFAYFHWAHNVFSTRVPFIDFLSYVPPGFVYIVAPLFFFFRGTAVLFAGRVFAWVVFVGICVSLGAIFVSSRGIKWRTYPWTLWLPGLVLAFLPMPADKFLEFRPDNLAMMLALIGTYFHIRGFSGGTKRVWFWAGVLYSVALIVLPKALPQVGIAVLITLGWWLWGNESVKQKSQSVGALVAGMGIPLGVFGIWAVCVARTLHGMDTIIYSLTRLPLEVNRIGDLFGMDPSLFFYPNDVYYGTPGWNIGLIVNHFIWLVGLTIGVVRLCTPFLGGKSEQHGVWSELLLAGSFVAYVAAFMYGYPLRHPQYLIPIAVFVAFYAADAVYGMALASETYPVHRLMFVTAYIVGIIFLCQVGHNVDTGKMAGTNATDVQNLQTALNTIPANTYVLDMVGSTIYFRDPYYVSAVPFGQWEPYLSQPLPDLVQALERTKTVYLYDGRSGRLHTLSPGDQSYIDATYSSVSSIVGLYMKK